MRKKSEKLSFLRNLSVDLSADASTDAPAIINIRKFPENTKENYGSEYFEKFYVLNLQNVIE